MIRSFHSKWSTSSILFLSHQKNEKEPPPPQVGADRAAVCPSASARRDLASRQECASRSNAATSPIFPPHRLFSGAQVVRVALGRPRPARAANLARLGFPTEVGVKIMPPGQQAGLRPDMLGPVDQPGSAERARPRSRWALLLSLGAAGRRAPTGGGGRRARKGISWPGRIWLGRPPRRRRHPQDTGRGACRSWGSASVTRGMVGAGVAAAADHDSLQVQLHYFVQSYRLPTAHGSLLDLYVKTS